ncbi:MAG: DNA polymerase III subunit gamma/tau [Pseudomonadota bacterium]
MLFKESDLPEQSLKEDGSYLVFARKYRPQNFDSLIGQPHLTTTLKNAFDAGRIAHAYILTGVRGVGKTTTARILAKGFNCTGPEGQTKAPTLKPCGVCENCKSITNGKNIDVFEMDAASRTGINDIREIIESLPYKPLTCRYKVFIIDEVHMLSTSAFNGLLKTLEEPPGHVKFIFATTEIHKIPATILSRCQRIDLKRVDIATLQSHFASICKEESVTFDDVALAQIARAADGSVRDGLSLLDQAVVRGGSHISLEAIGDMLGGSQTEACLDILELCQQHDAEQALTRWHELYKAGNDPHLFAKETLRHIEWLIKFKNAPKLAEDISLSEELRQKGSALAKALSVPHLSRMWDIAFKALQDIHKAPDPASLCDVMLVRMVYGLHMPDIMEVKEASDKAPSAMEEEIVKENIEKKTPDTAPAIEYVAQKPDVSTLGNLLNVIKDKRDLKLKKNLEMDFVVQDYKEGSITLVPVQSREAFNFSELQKRLETVTGISWNITVLDKKAEGQTVREQVKEAKQKNINAFQDNNIVKKIFEHFPKAKITDIADL